MSYEDRQAIRDLRNERDRRRGADAVTTNRSTRQRTDANEGESNQANANGIGAVMSQRQNNNNS